MGQWDMDTSWGSAPSNGVDMCGLRPRGIAGRARHRAIGMTAQHILTGPGAVWGNWGAQTDGSDSGYSSRNSSSGRGSTAMAKRRGSSRKQHWDSWGGGWPGSLAHSSNCASINSPDCTVTEAADT